MTPSEAHSQRESIRTYPYIMRHPVQVVGGLQQIPKVDRAREHMPVSNSGCVIGMSVEESVLSDQQRYGLRGWLASD